MKKKLISLCTCLAIMVSCYNPVMAAEAITCEDNCDRCATVLVGYDTTTVENDNITRDSMNNDVVAPALAEIATDTDQCKTEIVEYIPETAECAVVKRDLLVEDVARSTSKPSTFWNIASKGIYYGEFSGVAGTIYTNYYFDWEEDARCYYTRVNVSTHLYGDKKTFVVRNYCLTCGKLSESDEYETPGDFESTGYIYLKHSFSSSHDGHFMYPAVVCTASSGKIDGTIDVNYTNSWA